MSTGSMALGALKGAVQGATDAASNTEAEMSGVQARTNKQTKAPEYKRGGKLRSTKIIKAHKGERVLTAKQTRKYDKKKRGRK
jgi:hypothetical protein